MACIADKILCKREVIEGGYEGRVDKHSEHCNRPRESLSIEVSVELILNARGKLIVISLSLFLISLLFIYFPLILFSFLSVIPSIINVFL